MFFSLLPLGLPGGNQVDGLPPATSTDAAALGPAAITDLITKIGRKIEFFLRKMAIRPGSQNFPMSGMSVERRMQNGVALYSLAATAATGEGWAPGGPKNRKIFEKFIYFSKEIEMFLGMIEDRRCDFC